MINASAFSPVFLNPTTSPQNGDEGSFSREAAIDSVASLGVEANAGRSEGGSRSGGNSASGEQQVAADPQQQRDNKAVSQLSEAQLKQVRELATRDRAVRAHEQAHANVGGRYAGSPTYSFQRGPDGQMYAVGGEVSIDIAPVPSDPQATIQKARIVRRAAMAPAQPSAQDRSVAAQATAMEQQASTELLRLRLDNSKAESDYSIHHVDVKA